MVRAMEFDRPCTSTTVAELIPTLLGEHRARR